MKQNLSVFTLLIYCLGISQITQTIVNKEKFEASGFPYKGSRVLMVENISTPSEENYYLFSKNQRGSD